MFYDFPYIGNCIIPTDELLFFRGEGQPPTSKHWFTNCETYGWVVVPEIATVKQMEIPGETMMGQTRSWMAIRKVLRISLVLCGLRVSESQLRWSDEGSDACPLRHEGGRFDRTLKAGLKPPAAQAAQNPGQHLAFLRREEKCQHGHLVGGLDLFFHGLMDFNSGLIIIIVV